MENIGSARRVFFSFGSIGVFHGNLNPLSSRSVVETCVMPILLFGSECWYLSDPTLDEPSAVLVKESYDCPVSTQTQLYLLDLNGQA